MGIPHQCSNCYCSLGSHSPIDSRSQRTTERSCRLSRRNFYHRSAYPLSLCDCHRKRCWMDFSANRVVALDIGSSIGCIYHYTKTKQRTTHAIAYIQDTQPISKQHCDGSSWSSMDTNVVLP